MQLEDIEDWEGALTRVLRRSLETGESFRHAAAEVAYAIAEEKGANGDDIVDEFCDQVHDSLYDSAETLVSMFWPGSMISASGEMSIVDLGPGGRFIFANPMVEEGMELWGEYTDDDRLRKTVISEMTDGIHGNSRIFGFGAESISAAPPLTREDIRAPYLTVLTDDSMDVWPELAEVLSNLGGDDFDIDTPEQRERLLDAYLDKALKWRISTGGSDAVREIPG